MRLLESQQLLPGSYKEIPKQQMVLKKQIILHDKWSSLSRKMLGKVGTLWWQCEIWPATYLSHLFYFSLKILREKTDEIYWISALA